MGGSNGSSVRVVRKNSKVHEEDVQSVRNRFGGLRRKGSSGPSPDLKVKNERLRVGEPFRSNDHGNANAFDLIMRTENKSPILFWSSVFGLAD